MEHNLPPPDAKSKAPSTDLEQSAPDSFDFLISYDTDIRSWKSTRQELQFNQDKSTDSDRLGDLRGRRLANARQRVPVTSKSTNAVHGNPRVKPSIPQEIPVRDNGVAAKSLSQQRVDRSRDEHVNLFSPDSLPSSPVLNSFSRARDLRGSLSDSEQIVSGDKNTARYLRILVPHRDSSVSDVEEVCSPPRLGASLNYSETDPFEAPPSFAENLLLESPSDSPTHFSRLRLSLSTGESETDSSVFEPSSESITRTPFVRQDPSQNFQSVKVPTLKSQEVPTTKKRSSARRLLPDSHHRYTTKTETVFKVPETSFQATDSGAPQIPAILDEGTIRDLEKEIKRLVVEIYSEKEHRFVPIPGLKTTRMEQERVTEPQQDGIDRLKDAFQLENTVGPVPAMNGNSRSPEQMAAVDLYTDDVDKTPTSMSDALALQRSVISDSKTEPASMEDITAAIEEAQKQYRERLQYHRNKAETEISKPQNGSISSLDETPTRIPAPSSVAHSEIIPTKDVVEHTKPTPNHLPEAEQNHKGNDQYLRPVTVTKRPSSLVVQNTGLAISSAVAGRIGSQTAEKPGHNEQTLYRSPVQGITTSKGNVPDATDAKKSRKKQGKKDSQVYASPGDIQVKAAQIPDDVSGSRNKASSPTSSKAPSNIVSVQAAGDSAVHVQQTGLEPNTGMVITGGQPVGSGNVDEQRVHDNGARPSTVETTASEEKPKQQGSFLGSLFQWGRKTETTPPATPPPPQTDPVPLKDGQVDKVQDANGANSSPGTMTSAENTAADSGVDVVPLDSSAADVFHADFSPTHASTPMHPGHRSMDDTDSNTQQRVSRNPSAASRNLNAAYASDTVEETSPGVSSQTPPTGTFRTINPPVATQQLQGQSAPVASMRRRDLNKMPSTSLGGRPGGRGAAGRQHTRSDTVGSTAPSDVYTLMREKAKLEGQIESMGAETAAALQDRANLQSQVAALQVQLQSYSDGAEMAGAQRSAMETDLRGVEHHRQQLEQAVMALQTSLETKEDDLEGLRQDLEQSQATNQQLQKKLDDIRAEMDSKDSKMADVKRMMSDLQAEVEKAHQEKAESVAELKVLQSDVQSLVQSKEWFQEQLQFAQDARVKLQQDLAKAQTQVKSQGAAVENLKAENAQVKQDLNRTRTQALQEKEQIAKHLETIEADMVAREAAFGAIQREKLAVQAAVAERMDQMQEERQQLTDLIATSVELERQLDSAQKQLTGKRADLKALEAEKSELARAVTLAQDTVITRDRELATLQHRYDDIEDKLNDLLGESANQDETLHQLQQEKASLEAALSSANVEKRAFDNTLQNLRKDMGKVENSFKQLRQELGEKNEELEAVQREREQLMQQLQIAEHQLRDQEQNVESYTADIENKNDIVNELAGVKSALEKELGALKNELQDVRNSERDALQVKKKVEGELKAVREDLQDMESQLQDALTENAHLEGQVEMMADDQQRFAQLLEENGTLKQKVAEVQSSTHRDLADKKAKILRLGSDLSQTQKELKEKQKTYESAAGTLTRKLKEAMEAKQAAERDLQALKNNTARTTKEEHDRSMSELESARKGLSVVQDQRDRLEQELQRARRTMEDEAAGYRGKVGELEEELKSLKDLCDEQQRNEEANRKMALELERERGRLVGVQQSHHALKQHTALLEAALGRRESTLAELSAQFNDSNHERAGEEDRLRSKLQSAVDALEGEKHTGKHLRKQLATEKGEAGRVQRDLQGVSIELDQLRKDLERKTVEAEAAKTDLDSVKQIEKKQKSELQVVKGQLDDTRAQVEQLKRQLQQSQAKDPILQDQIKGITWENEQKTQEIEALKEQLELAERRQQIELDGAQSAVQMSKQELERIKAELGGTRKEKFAFQTKVGQLKAALKATLQQNKLLKAKLKSKSKSGQRRSSTDSKALPQSESATSGGRASSLRDEIVVPELAYDVEALLAKDDMDSISSPASRPLQSIQGCMSSLKNQMGILQEQMTEHTAAVNTSNEAWREVENKVRDLRRACTPPAVSIRQHQPGTTTPPVSRPHQSRSNGGISTPPQQAATTPNHTTPKSSMSTPGLPNVQDL